MNLALDDIQAGRGIAVIDPKGDLVSDLLERIPRQHWGRVRLGSRSRPSKQQPRKGPRQKPKRRSKWAGSSHAWTRGRRVWTRKA